MRARVAAWLRRTHSPLFELTRHFSQRLFDSDLVTAPGEWVKPVVGIFAVALSVVILMAQMFLSKYSLVNPEFRERMSGTGLLLQEIRSDEHAFIAFSMAITALLAALVWQSLFPSLRDFLALAGYPVRPRQIFAAKFFAILLLFSAFVIAFTVPSALMFGGVSSVQGVDGPAHVLGTLISWAGGCIFIFFSLIAVQGLLLNVLPARWFGRVSVWVQALLLTGAMCAIPLLDLLPAGKLWWPAEWFVSLWASIAKMPGGDARPAVAALLVAPLVAVLSYVASYHRYRKLLLETPVEQAAHSVVWLDWLMRRFVSDPRETAMLTFIFRSMFRSRTHRFVLLACAGLALALNVRVMVDAASGSEELRFAVIFGPLAMSAVALAGLRYLFALPAELRANWLFRLTEREGRLAWLRGVERFVLWFGVAPIYVVWFPATCAVLGIGAVVAYMQAVALTLLLFERMFRGWRKAPFTCSYLPGSQPLWKSIFTVFYVPGLLAGAAGIFQYGVFHPLSFFLVLPFLTVLWRRARERRLAEWLQRPLIWESSETPDLELLGLQSDVVRVWADSTESDSIWSGGFDDESRVLRLWRWLSSLPFDVWHGLRSLVQKPGFALPAILILGLGLGLNTAFFTVYNAYCLRPAAVTDPYSLFEYWDVVYENDEPRNMRPRPASMAQYREVARRTDVLAEVMGRSMVVSRVHDRVISGMMVSENYFSSLGGRASMGRLILKEDREPVAVLSHRAWKNRFGGDPRVLGQALEVQRVLCTIVGVADPTFTGVATDRDPDFWVPMAAYPDPLEVEVLVRLKKGLVEQQAETALLHTARESRPQERVRAVKLYSAATIIDLSNYVEMTGMFFLIFAFTMAIPCANVANMMLARGIERQKEIGIKLALGATRGRIVRQLLTEAVVIAFVGGAAGVLIARVAVDMAVRTLHATLPWVVFLRRVRIPELPLDERVLFYLFLVALCTAVASALLPALQVVQKGVGFSLRREMTGSRSSWLRDALVAGQVGVCLMLLVCAFLLIRGTSRMTSLEPGFDATDLHIMAKLDGKSLDLAYQALRRQGWLESVTRANRLPMEMLELWGESSDGKRAQWLRYNLISDGYFSTLRIPLLRGRDFTPSEMASQSGVVIVSEGTANRLWPGENPLGQILRIDPRRYSSGARRPRALQSVVVGVVREKVKSAGMETDRMTSYHPMLAQSEGMVLMRGRSTTKVTGNRIEQLLMSLPGGDKLEVTVPMEDVMYVDSYAARAGSWVASVLGGLALLFTASGVYAVMAFIVGQRTREIGIRMALGATGHMIVMHMLRYSARLVAIGVCIGVFLALWGAKLISASTLYINPHDVVIYFAGIVLVGFVSLLTTLQPALRASRVDPMSSLRLE